jgi:hypothetical protein
MYPMHVLTLINWHGSILLLQSFGGVYNFRIDFYPSIDEIIETILILIERNADDVQRVNGYFKLTHVDVNLEIYHRNKVDEASLCEIKFYQYQTLSTNSLINRIVQLLISNQDYHLENSSYSCDDLHEYLTDAIIKYSIEIQEGD